MLKHLIEGSEKTGDNDAPRLSMDNLKSLFPSKMVYSSHKHVFISKNQICLAETIINEACEKYPLLRMFQEPGLAIPQEKDLQLSKLYNTFIQSYTAVIKLKKKYYKPPPLQIC